MSSGQDEELLHLLTGQNRGRKSLKSRISNWWSENDGVSGWWFKSRDEKIKLEKAGKVLIFQGFISGVSDATVYSNTSSWATFMTGNVIQLTLSGFKWAVVRPRPEQDTTPKDFFYSLCALASFAIAALIALFLSSYKGLHGAHRGKLVMKASARFFLLAFSTIPIFKTGWGSYWSIISVGLLAASMGILAVATNQLKATINGIEEEAIKDVKSATIAATKALPGLLFNDSILPQSLMIKTNSRGKSIISLIGGALSTQLVTFMPTLLTQDKLKEFPILERYGSGAMMIVIVLAEGCVVYFWSTLEKEE